MNYIIDMVKHPSQPFPTRKKVPIARILNPFQTFLKYEASSGLILIFTIIIALTWVNLYQSSYFAVWETYLTISFGKFTISKEITLWINDLLMAIFFLVIGLEIKRELLVGDLRDPKKAMLPISAAIGGIILPAIIYLIFNFNNIAYVDGWAIPAATDIAFALGILYLLGNKVPVSARIFLATLAIIDDIIAILIIAIFYTEEVKYEFIILAFVMFLFLIILNLLNVRRILPYMIIGIILWYGFFGSGIHATIAGIFFAMTIPATTKINHIEFKKKSSEIIDLLVDLTKENELSADDLPLYMNSIAALEYTCQEIEAPLQRLEHALVPWVTFGIMPVFALANAGVVISGNLLSQTLGSLSLGIIFGLIIGKPVGVFVSSYIAVKFKIAKLPSGISWKQIMGIGFLSGIGFTMSTFIATLAFKSDPTALEVSKLAILIASFFAGIIGYFLLHYSNNKLTLESNESNTNSIYE